MRRLLALLAVVVLATVSLTSCSSTSSSRTINAAEAQQMIDKGAGVIDVRTPQEFAEGHLVGAMNIDVESPDFEQKVSQLDKNVTYVVYCRSGNRAGTAIQKMEDLGFTDLSNAGGFADLANQGIPWE
jgi:rhodanese-related sulfurtransferase